MARKSASFDFRTAGGNIATEEEPRNGSTVDGTPSGIENANGETSESQPVIFDPAEFNNTASDATSDAASNAANDTPGDTSGEWFGRKRKRTSRKAAKAENLEVLLLSIHQMLAAFSQVEELELAEEEAKKFSEAISRVQKLYDYKWISDEAAAWGNLIVAAGSIYGPRYMAYRLRRKKEEAEERFQHARHVPSASAG